MFSIDRDSLRISELLSRLQLRLDSAALSGVENMAIDEALLLSAASSDIPILGIYGWEEPTVSVGYFEPYASAAGAAMPVIRRWIGGGVVRHGSGEDLTYSLTVPARHPFCKCRPAASYQAIHGMLVTALVASGSGVKA